ncbi:Gag-like protein, partial [Macrolepiota fuliginosa MF-IS2]
GTQASSLIGQSLFLNGGQVTIKGTKAHTRTPQCQRCWKWGHTTSTCCHPAIQCPICSGPHLEANHHLIARCCYGNPKATPPIPPTLADAPCLHVHACINCGNPHAANNWCCPYWCHQFNWTWIKDQSIRDALAHKGVPPPPTTPCG